jgi:hypothetical protein
MGGYYTDNQKRSSFCDFFQFKQGGIYGVVNIVGLITFMEDETVFIAGYKTSDANVVYSDTSRDNGR